MRAYLSLRKEVGVNVDGILESLNLVRLRLCQMKSEHPTDCGHTCCLGGALIQAAI